MKSQPISRRAMIGGLLGLAGAGVLGSACSALPGLPAVVARPAAHTTTAPHPAEMATAGAAEPLQDGPFPAWVNTMPRGVASYEAANRHLDLMATLPCFCGCMRYEKPHASLRDCFVQPSGEIEPHAAFCQTCQDEALDAVRMAEEGVTWTEIHTRILADYADQDPMTAPAGGSCSPDAERPSCG